VKAREYADLWNSWMKTPPTLGELYDDAPPGDSLKPGDKVDLSIALCSKVMLEMDTIAKARNATSLPAIASILTELDQKWAAIVRRIGDPFLNEKMFMDFCKMATTK
jgi:hypothetical protein